ncbi:MAG: hypothetical protein QOF48_540 [Verrucomicrobiota bacterium]|jgi:hypothetical protein
MKTIIAVLIAVVLGFAGGYFYISRKNAEGAATASAAESTWAAEKAALEQQLADARRRSPEVRTVTRTLNTTVTNKLAPEEILARLARLNPETSEDSRNSVLRQVVHLMETLADAEEAALPVIRDFLKRNKDIDYSTDVLNAAGERVGRSGAASWTTRHSTLTDFLVPPSLRLGLIDVLDQIGGEEAQGILAEVLDTTGRGVEVAHIARVLQREVPDKYRDNALKAAKDLLANPPAVDQPNRIDENARAYLFQVLAMYNDTSFATSAQQMLVTPAGQVDRQALNYLSSTLKDQAVPQLYAAYKDPKLTNMMERSSLVNAILGFTGTSAEANQIFGEIIGSEEIPSGIRAFTIKNLAGGQGTDRPTDPQVLQSRINLLGDLRGRTKDERLIRSIDDTRTTLEQLLSVAKLRE